MFFSSPAGGKYVDRGLQETTDYTEETLDMTAGWHELDISGIIGKGEKLVLIELYLASATGNREFVLRTHNQEDTKNFGSMFTGDTGGKKAQLMSVLTDKDGKIDHFTSLATGDFMHATIRGWFV